MLFYFSGTGNSEWAARRIADELSERLFFIPDEMGGDCRYVLRSGERLGFVFPTYAWGVPQLVLRFIERMEVSGVDYLYFVTTCGDDTGLLADEFCEAVSRKGWACRMGSAVQMPESYVCLPGFDVDPEDREHLKRSQAQIRLDMIVDNIIDGRGGFDTLPGSCAWLKSAVLRPLFRRYLTSPTHFHTTDACTGCGRCVEACPLHNIRLADGNRPAWDADCAMCLRCYHQCPARAIEWGRYTRGKGQYLFARGANK